MSRCWARAGSAPATAQSLTGAGATFPNPIYTKWFDAYNKKTGVQINYQSIGSGGGIRQFTEGTVDFGATDGPMNDEQIAAVNGNVLHMPTVLGAVVLTYNLPDARHTKLKFDGESIAEIFMGRVTKWNDRRSPRSIPASSCPTRTSSWFTGPTARARPTSSPITSTSSPVSGRTKSGKATSVNWPVGLGGKGNEGVTEQIKQTEGALGYVELIYALSNNLPYCR